MTGRGPDHPFAVLERTPQYDDVGTRAFRPKFLGCFWGYPRILGFFWGYPKFTPDFWGKSGVTPDFWGLPQIILNFLG